MEVAGRLRRGLSVFDFRGTLKRAANVRLVTAVDMGRLAGVLGGCLR